MVYAAISKKQQNFFLDFTDNINSDSEGDFSRIKANHLYVQNKFLKVHS